MLIYGWRLYGRVDNVPGLFYVATQFLHVFYFPVFPVQTFLIVANPENPSETKVFKIALSLRSAIMSYYLSSLVALGLALLFFGTIAALRAEHGFIMWSFPILGVGCLLAWWSQRKPRLATQERAMELGNRAGIHVDLVATAMLPGRSQGS